MWGSGGVRLPISVLTCVFHYLVASLVRLHSTVWKLPVWILSMVMCPVHPTYLKCKAAQLFVAPVGTWYRTWGTLILVFPSVCVCVYLSFGICLFQVFFGCGRQHARQALYQLALEKTFFKVPVSSIVLDMIVRFICVLGPYCLTFSPTQISPLSCFSLAAISCPVLYSHPHHLKHTLSCLCLCPCSPEQLHSFSECCI